MNSLQNISQHSSSYYTKQSKKHNLFGKGSNVPKATLNLEVDRPRRTTKEGIASSYSTHVINPRKKELSINRSREEMMYVATSRQETLENRAKSRSQMSIRTD